MAKVKFPNDNVEVEVPAGTMLRDVVENNGVNIHFACGDGRCGACLVKIVKGMENLNQRTESEKRTLELLGAEPDKRLACQVKIEKNGDVVVENVY